MTVKNSGIWYEKNILLFIIKSHMFSRSYCENLEKYRYFVQRLDAVWFCSAYISLHKIFIYDFIRINNIKRIFFTRIYWKIHVAIKCALTSPFVRVSTAADTQNKCRIFAHTCSDDEGLSDNVKHAFQPSFMCNKRSEGLNAFSYVADRYLRLSYPAGRNSTDILASV